MSDILTIDFAGVAEQSERIQPEIKRRILELIVDNPRLACVQLELETAAMIGASIVLETEQ